MALEFFNAYHSYLKSIEPLNDAERGRLFTALLEYSNTGVNPDLRGNERFIFPMIREQIDRDKARYEAKCKRNRENVAVRWNTTVYESIPDDTKNTKTKEKEKEKTKEKAKDKEKESNNRRFTPPTLAEIADYCRERGNNVDPKKVFDYYEANAWKDSSGKPVKSWKQKIISVWENDENKAPKQGRNAALLESIQRDMQYDTNRNKGLYISDVATLVEL